MNVRDLDAARAQRQGQLYHRLDAPDIGAMHDQIDGQRKTEAHDLAGNRTLAGGCALVAGDVIGGCLLEVLDRYLHVIEAFGECLRRQPDARRDQVAVEARITRRLDDFVQVAPRRGLTSGQMDLQNAERGRFPENPCPGRRIDLVVAPVASSKDSRAGSDA